jgi:hypothetical protein
MKRFKVLEVNNVIKNSTSYTKSCVVEDLETKEIISIIDENACGLRAEIIDKIDNF